MFWEKGKKEKGKRIEMIKGREKGFVQVVRKKREKKKKGSWEVGRLRLRLRGPIMGSM